MKETETVESILKVLNYSSDDENHQSTEDEEFEDSSTEMSATILFKDVEDALEKFTGEGEKGVEADETAINYDLLLTLLRKEFPEELTTIEIHEKLVARKKKANESYLQYFYHMQKIGKMKMDNKSMIQYIVNGISDSGSAKAILYDATTLDGLKLKLKTYEMMKNQREASTRGKVADKMQSSHSSTEASTSNGKRCYGCGSKSHQRNQCPDKSKGGRCFNCNNG